MSPITANAETTSPPMMNRAMSSITIVLAQRGKVRAARRYTDTDPMAVPTRLLLILIVLGAALAACGPQNRGASGTTLRIWYSTDDPVERSWSQDLARRFERSHPHIRVQLTDYSFEDLNTKL